MPDIVTRQQKCWERL